MKFIDLPVFNQDGKEVTIPINPEFVTMLVNIRIPSNITEADGVPVAKPGIGIKIGDDIIPTKLTEQEAKDLLEGNTKPNFLKFEDGTKGAGKLVDD